MTPRALCTAGEYEGLKALAHGVLLVGSVVCVVYNGVAWCYRREVHLARNVGAYGVAVAWETKKVLHHLKRT